MLGTGHSPADVRIILRESTSLVKNGYEVTAIAKENANKALNVTEKNGIKIITIFYNQFNKFPRLKITIDTFAEAKKVNADIYHAHEPETFHVALLMKLLYKKKIVFDVHEFFWDLWHVPKMPFKSKLMLMYFTEIAVPLFARFFNGIITADEAITDIYSKYNKNVFTVPNFPPYPYNFIKEYHNPPVVIYAGGLNDRRNIFEIIKAIHKIKEHSDLTVKLQLFGPWHDVNYKKQCMDYIKENKLNDLISYNGYVGFDILSKYMEKASIGIALYDTVSYPYINNVSYPTKILEYMSFKIPVIHSNLTKIMTWMDQYSCGDGVDANNPDDIAITIISLLQDKDKLKRMGDTGFKVITSGLNWSECEKTLLDFYKII